MSRARKKKPGVPSGVPKPAKFSPRVVEPPREKRLHRYCVVRVVRQAEPSRGGTKYEVEFRDRRVVVEEPMCLERPGVDWKMSEHPVRGGLGLKVGRHDRKLGIVFIVRKRGKSRAQHTSWSHGNLERGLVEWDGRTKTSLMKAAVVLALTHAGFSSPSEELLRAVEREWRSLPLWEDLVRRRNLGENLDIVREVMET